MGRGREERLTSTRRSLGFTLRAVGAPEWWKVDLHFTGVMEDKPRSPETPGDALVIVQVSRCVCVCVCAHAHAHEHI